MPQDADPTALLRWIRAKTFKGHGSGWLIERGLILTNEHVVEGTERVVVRQSTAPPFEADVVGVDTVRDTALLQFDPTRHL